MNKAGDVTAQRLTWRATSAQTTYRSAGTRGILPRSSAAAPAEVSDRKAACSAAGSAWRQHPSRSLWQLYNNGCGQRQTSVLLCFDKMLTDVQVHVCSKVPGRLSHLSGKNQTSMNVQLVLVGFSLVHFTFWNTLWRSCSGVRITLLRNQSATNTTEQQKGQTCFKSPLWNNFHSLSFCFFSLFFPPFACLSGRICFYIYTFSWDFFYFKIVLVVLLFVCLLGRIHFFIFSCKVCLRKNTLFIHLA